jgi:hypothetical protein
VSIASIAMTALACGGSSSETPPPLQPDPAGFRYASKATPRAAAGDGGLSSITNDPDDDGKPPAPEPKK